jgi:hypothetical protein
LPEDLAGLQVEAGQHVGRRAQTKTAQAGAGRFGCQIAN